MCDAQTQITKVGIMQFPNNTDEERTKREKENNKVKGFKKAEDSREDASFEKE